MKDYMDKRKETVFDNDLNTRTMIISKMWDMREKSMNSFQELDFLLSANGVSENKKIRKGLLKIANDMIEIGEKLKKHLEIEEAELSDETSEIIEIK